MPPQVFTSGRRRVVRSISGHFGELLQGRLGPGGPLVLVTLPAPALRVTARYDPAGRFAVHGANGARLLERTLASRLYRTITDRPPRGRLVLQADMPAGGGAGSSTAALLAAAAAFCHGSAPPSAERLAQICLRIEGASDPLMFPDPGALLWAPRQGRVIRALPRLPSLEIVGGFLGPAQRTDPADQDFADVSDLVALWPAAAARGDVAALAALATASARRNAERRGGPDLAPLLAMADRLGALGVVAAHTGSARGLIFRPRHGRPDQAAEALRSLGARAVRRFGLVSTAPAR